MKGDFSMVKLYDGGVYLVNGREIVTDAAALPSKCGRTVTKEEAEQGTIAYGILKAHNKSGDMQNLRMRFDSLTSHDITYVGIIQTARASGMKEFPMPYVLTNCHNSLCAVGGTINEDDHMFALSAAHKYGGIYVPTNMAVIHSYNREMMSGCGTHDPRFGQPHPLRRAGHDWPSARAAASWPSSWWAAPTTSRVRAWSPST